MTNLADKIIIVLVIWILSFAAIGITMGFVQYFNKPASVKVDCTTHNFNPDSIKEHRELCRRGK